MVPNTFVGFADDVAFENRQVCAASEKCGCCYCHAIFDPTKIVAYTDRGLTVLCPFCGIDAVIASSDAITLTYAFLQQVGDIWFKKHAV
jgi:hypothetical protein